jgi:glucose/arabinose dehydrogenase
MLVVDDGAPGTYSARRASPTAGEGAQSTSEAASWHGCCSVDRERTREADDGDPRDSRTQARGRPHAGAAVKRPPIRRALAATLLAAPVVLGGCADRATLPVEAGTGPRPQLPAPTRQIVPTVDIAPARGWREGERPTAADGLTVAPFATGLDHPRWLLVLPNGDVLVAETNAPDRPDDRKGLRGFVMSKVMARAGAGVPSPDRITLLRDTDGDGVADRRFVFAQGLYSPFGMALVGADLYVANSDALVRFHYETGATAAQGPPTRVVDLPAGMPVDVLSGFVDANGDARGRPVGVAIDGHGALLVADDVGNTVWRVTAAERRDAQEGAARGGIR